MTEGESRDERESRTHRKWGANSSIELMGASSGNYFPQSTPFFILQLFEPSFFNFFLLGDLKHYLPIYFSCDLKYNYHRKKSIIIIRILS